MATEDATMSASSVGEKRKAETSLDEPAAKKSRTTVFGSVADQVNAAQGSRARKKASLELADGLRLEGFSFGAETCVAGEAVFNTGMVGYPESLTDPSYAGQILILTYPLVGNYGVPDDRLDEFGLKKYFESDKVQITGLIVSDYSHDHSHHEAFRSLGSWLKEHNVPGIYGLDTRELTKRIRTSGAMLAKIEFPGQAIDWVDPNKTNLVARVSRTEPLEFGKEHKTKVLAVDCGIKNNIIRYLAGIKKVNLKVVPWDYDFTAEEFDGLFISNGPGDPTMADKTIQHLKKVMEERPDTPIFGICLGHQLLALAAGCKTYKMKFGNRGMNQPVLDMRTTRCYITPQNHGFAVDDKELPKDWDCFFKNANDHSNEGIIHKHLPRFSVQFHPEAMGGPTDTEFLFDMFLTRVEEKVTYVTTVPFRPRPDVNKVLLLGSGGLSIGQAGEFDYSGSQCIKALREENVRTVLINPNIATVQTSWDMADEVYFLPVTLDYVTQVIEKERPDGILLQFGGQTALNCGIQLRAAGVLEKYDVRVLGTPIPTIEMTEDRDAFAQEMAKIGEKCAPSDSAETIDGALAVAARLGYPVLCRAAFTLGGLGSGFAKNEAELRALAGKAFANTTQVIIDKSLKGWKEVEYEVVRDSMDNCITVCNMENFDPLGIHTGDSIVVAPSQTLTNREYYALRSTAIKVIRHLGVIGECNIQYALDPNSDDYTIIEVNARLSRSSALASKATGYPLAYVAAKLAMGLQLTDIKNSVTKCTTACFEPSLDYCVVKIPRWDMRKFSQVSNKIGSGMKSVGEVMGIGRKFEEAFSKAIRMVHSTGFGFETCFDRDTLHKFSNEQVNEALNKPDDQRVWAIVEAFRREYTVDRIHELTKIDPWFLCKLRNILACQRQLANFKVESVPRDLLLQAKELGLCDIQISKCLKSTNIQVRNRRKEFNLMPWVKQIDTLAAEFPAQTNYLYTTYNGSAHDLTFDSHGVMVLGCGAYRIGSSCEFDWCAVSALRTLHKMGKRPIVVNYNPETVSTDYDESDRLYFEELSFESVLDIYDIEKSEGLVVSVGGQIPNNLALPLHQNGVNILGTQPDSIDNCEDRGRFSKMLDELGIDQPKWDTLKTTEDAIRFADRVGYPVLVRPSYVLSGAAMNVASNKEDLLGYLEQATDLSSDHPVVISKFILGAKEIEMDAVAQDGRIINYAVSEHVENAGVHSGDATLVLPAQNLYVETMKQVKRMSSMIAHKLKITGPFNIQFLARGNMVKVIECNMRSSRSFPFVSKTFDINFIELATRAMCGEVVKSRPVPLGDMDRVCVKAPMFSFTRLAGADPVLRCEMSSTGEVACYGMDKYEAFQKALISAGFKWPSTTSEPKRNNICLSLGPTKSKVKFLDEARILERLGYNLWATMGTHQFLTENGVKSTLCYKPKAGKEPQLLNLLSENKINILINIPNNLTRQELTEGYKIRRKTVDYSVPLLTNVQLAKLFVQSIEYVKLDEHHIMSWGEHLAESHLSRGYAEMFATKARRQAKQMSG